MSQKFKHVGTNQIHKIVQLIGSICLIQNLSDDGTRGRGRNDSEVNPFNPIHSFVWDQSIEARSQQDESFQEADLSHAGWGDAFFIFLLKPLAKFNLSAGTSS